MWALLLLVALAAAQAGGVSSQPLDAAERLFAWVRELGGMVRLWRGGRGRNGRVGRKGGPLSVRRPRPHPATRSSASPQQVKAQAKADAHGVRSLFATDFIAKGSYISSVPAACIINAGGTDESFAVGPGGRREGRGQHLQHPRRLRLRPAALPPTKSDPRPATLPPPP